MKIYLKLKGIVDAVHFVRINHLACKLAFRISCIYIICAKKIPPPESMRRFYRSKACIDLVGLYSRAIFRRQWGFKLRPLAIAKDCAGVLFAKLFSSFINFPK
jgi:hypothetical protein